MAKTKATKRKKSNESSDDEGTTPPILTNNKNDIVVPDIAKIIENGFKKVKNEMKNEIREVQNEIKEFKEAVNLISTTIRKVEEDVEKLQEVVGKNEYNISFHQSEIEYLQIQIRKLNLIIVGLEESSDETKELLEKKVQEVIKNTLEIKDISISTDGCFRIGKIYVGKHRNIKIKLCTELHREAILSKRHLLKEKKLNIYINEDLPTSVLIGRINLRLECSKARMA